MKNISQILANGKMNAMDIVKVLIHNDLAYRSAGKKHWTKLRWKLSKETSPNWMNFSTESM